VKLPVDRTFTGAEVNDYIEKLVSQEKKINEKLGKKISDLNIELSTVQAEMETIQEFTAAKLNELNGLQSVLEDKNAIVEVQTRRMVEMESQLAKYREVLQANALEDPFHPAEQAANDGQQSAVAGTSQQVLN
jgi:predicted  nucleic acid-binding Zn-ribbon protein